MSWVDLKGESAVGKLVAVQGLIGGVGMGCVFGSSSLVLVGWFERWAGLVGGVSAVGGAVGKFVSFLLLLGSGFLASFSAWRGWMVAC